MPAIDKSIPSAVFTRTSSNSDLPESQAQSKSTSGVGRSPPLIKQSRPPSESTRDNTLTKIEEGGRQANAQLIADNKTDEILSCLEGTLEPSVEGHRYEVDDEDRVVDLWHLRHLALSRGGLMSPALRKRAWPKLVGVDEHILTTTSASIPSLISSGASVSAASVGSEGNDEEEPESIVELTNKDIKGVKQDIERCLWHVEYHIKMLRKQREKGRGGDGNTSKDSKSSVNNNASALANFSTSTSSQSNSMESPDPEKPQRRSKREMGLILNIITAVLRSVPEGEERSRLHYFHGLHDVAALFLINLESPSLTSLVMKRLCHLHFRDAMRPNHQKVQIILQAVIMPLLETIDKNLHNYIIQGGTDDSSVFALSWILTWFAHDFHNFDVVSRLFDVFLVSHPLFPAYLSVAVLTHPANRAAIMSTNCEFSALYETICELPKKMTAHPEESEVMNSIEDIIQSALTYIGNSPPCKLIALARLYRGGYLKQYLVTAPSVFLLEDPPRWAIAPTAPTDWSLIKLAKLMRTQSPESRLARRRCLRLRHFVEKIDLTSDEHDIALVAFGLETSSSKGRRRRLKKTNGLIGIALLVGALCGYEHYRGPSPLVRLMPSTSLFRMLDRSFESVSQMLSKPKFKPKSRRRPKPKPKPKLEPKLEHKPALLTTEKEVKHHKDAHGVLPSDDLSEHDQGVASSPQTDISDTLPVGTSVGSILKEMQADLNQLETEVDQMKDDARVEYIPISTLQEPIDVGIEPIERPTQAEGFDKDQVVSSLPPSNLITTNDQAISSPSVGTHGAPALAVMENDDDDDDDKGDTIRTSTSQEPIDIETATKGRPTEVSDDVDSAESVPYSSQGEIDVKLPSEQPSDSESKSKEKSTRPNGEVSVSTPSLEIDEESSLMKTDQDPDEEKDTTIISPDPEEEIISGIKEGLRKIITQTGEDENNILGKPVAKSPQTTNHVEEGSSADLVLKLFQREIEKTAKEILLTENSDEIMKSIFPPIDDGQETNQGGELTPKVIELGDHISRLLPPIDHATIPIKEEVNNVSSLLPVRIHAMIPIPEDGDNFNKALQVRVPEGNNFKQGNLKVIHSLVGLIRAVKNFFRWLLLNEVLVFI